ncbi:MAG: hypothetical protein M5U01_18265 [Ardenticatenaceae bacterium]|nr:hypothetical protein [Ardenticatenaceae bacterium]
MPHVAELCQNYAGEAGGNPGHAREVHLGGQVNLAGVAVQDSVADTMVGNSVGPVGVSTVTAAAWKVASAFSRVRQSAERHQKSKQRACS